jgi:hypothetical protein
MEAQWLEAQKRMATQPLDQFVPSNETLKPKKIKKGAAAAAAVGAAAAPAADADEEEEEDKGEEEPAAVYNANTGRTRRVLARCGLTYSVRATRRAVRFWLQRHDNGMLVFPDLVSIALLVLSVPTGIADVERSFNDLRTIQTTRRLNLTHKNREHEAYMCHNRHLLRGLVLLPDDWFLPLFA